MRGTAGGGIVECAALQLIREAPAKDKLCRHVDHPCTCVTSAGIPGISTSPPVALLIGPPKPLDPSLIDSAANGWRWTLVSICTPQGLKPTPVTGREGVIYSSTVAK